MKRTSRDHEHAARGHNCALDVYANIDRTFEHVKDLVAVSGKAPKAHKQATHIGIVLRRLRRLAPIRNERDHTRGHEVGVREDAVERPLSISRRSRLHHLGRIYDAYMRPR